MTYTELICDLGIFALIAVAAVICGILLLAFAYTIICFLAWIEDEVLRWFACRRRRARMRARAAENRARMQEKKPSVREGKKESPSRRSATAPFRQGGLQKFQRPAARRGRKAREPQATFCRQSDALWQGQTEVRRA